ncbi:M56 family metallopeptidase [Puniceicoccaceae bacterium K14]|nr:M56 family metallopeptidase [Puniceicoccaceae bacterium K14]
MADLFWAYWEASFRFALLALVLFALTPILKRWLSAKLICWAWAILILRLVLPLSLPVSGNLFDFHDALHSSAWTDAIRKSVVTIGWGETILPQFRDQDDMVLASRVGFSWENLFIAVWLLGTLVCSFFLASNIVRLSRFIKRAERLNSGPLYELFKDVRRRYGIHSNVPLLISKDVSTPGIAGIFNPRIILPQSCADELSEEELRCVFVHELTHFRRGDLFVHHALLLICYLHWFNPFVWLVLRNFKISMEQACDSQVMDSVCAGTAQQYGYTLLEVLKRSHSRRDANVGALCLIGNRKVGALKERIELIAKPKRLNPVLAAVGLCVFGLGFAYGITSQESAEQETTRLFRLTRLATPFSANSNKVPYDSPERSWDKVSVEYGAAPRNWVQVADVSKFKGQNAKLVARVRMDGFVTATEIWACVSDIDGKTLSYVSNDNENSVKAGERGVCEVLFNVPDDATEICYGLAIKGSGSAWVEDIDIVTSDPSELALGN